MGAAAVILGFDHGRAGIGVAVGQSLTATARPLTTLPARDGVPDWSGLDRLIAEWRPGALVVGLPLRSDGSDSGSTRAARAFAGKLGSHYGLTVDLHDERLTTRAAAERWRDARQAGRARAREHDHLHARAAALILESWLASQP